MVEDERIGAEEAYRLTSFIEQGNPRILAAYKEHVDNQVRQAATHPSNTLHYLTLYSRYMCFLVVCDIALCSGAI